MNYIKLYSDTYGITWDTSKMEIHHIDGNHNNDEIKNLILLPKELHREIHSAKYDLIKLDGGIQENITRMEYGLLNGWQDWGAMAIVKYIDTLYKAAYWAILKNQNYCTPDGKKMEYVEVSHKLNF